MLVNDDFSIDTLQERKINMETRTPIGDNEILRQIRAIFWPTSLHRVCIFSLKIINEYDKTTFEVADTGAA